MVEYLKLLALIAFTVLLMAVVFELCYRAIMALVAVVEWAQGRYQYYHQK